MKIFTYILLFFSLTLKAQSDGKSAVDFAIELSDMQMDMTIGNACGEERDEIVIYGDYDMNGHTLQLLSVKLTIINGTIIDEGDIIFSCANSIIAFEP